MLEKVYRDLCQTNQQNLPINIIGDSSGGGIALSLAQLVRNKEMPLAKNVILLSPSLDMSPLREDEKQIANELEKIDCMLSVNSTELIRTW